MPEIIKTLAYTALNYSTLNTVMFVGLVIAFSLCVLLFYANGCALHIHNIYDLDEKRWYRKSMTACKLLLIVWSAVYAVCLLFSFIGIIEVVRTYIFALICAICIGIGITLAYNTVWYLLVSPCLYLFGKRRK